jgi:hypothetical protein
MVGRLMRQFRPLGLLLNLAAMGAVWLWFVPKVTGYTLSTEQVADISNAVFGTAVGWLLRSHWTWGDE